MKKIIICADDFAQNEFVSDAILTLVKAGRLSAVSCMTTSKQWFNYGKKLLDVASDVDVGLHFDLTHFNPIGPGSFPGFLLSCCLNRFDPKVIEQRLNVQLDAFEHVMGRAPDFIDGHQHVHILPYLRAHILNLLKRRYGNNLPYLRQVNPTVFRSNALVKALVLRLFAVGFKSLATKEGFQLSKNFFGIYSLKSVNYSLLFKTWLSHAPDGSIIMCHPGYASTDLVDPIKMVRIVEFNYLASEKFLQDLEENNIKISRGSNFS